MGEKKVAIMRLKVDLQCEKCYRKVKKVLYRFPQIQDQVYDEKQNTVTIKVDVCCSPEKIMQNICSKGGDSIKSIEIIPPPKPKEPEKPKQKPIEPLPAPAKAEPPKQDKPKVTFVDPPPNFPPSAYQNPGATCWREWYEGRGEGPCYQQGYYGPPRCYCGYNGKPVYEGVGGGGYDGGGGGGYGGVGRGGYDGVGRGGGDFYRVNRCDYFSEENPNAACRIM